MIKRVKRELVYQGSILDIYNDSIQLPDGKIEHWDYVEHRKGAAAVVAVLEDGRLLLVRQYRNALNRFTLEIPAGARDSVTEPTSECAARELEEETGYRCDNLEFLISLKTTVAFCNELVDVYVARNLIPSKQKLDEGEEIELEAHTLEDLCEKIYKGEIQDGKTVAAIMAYKNKYHL
ncbi:NUDIX hydrolase [Roseburia sp. MSJ-14]|uniref:NUDIX hydrolase n=1 Tax=Roseburia sp. MSJ-14 TaxID=2841514 RepID=UPI001C10242F|nr:NUDIX hydrolase [Roseburia sp. MSJ-14]MBU5472577.1 NUDIX hydrolase [Roseburia sp. MSJ-14]